MEDFGNIEGIEDITEDLKSDEIVKHAIDFILNYENELLSLDELSALKDEFVEMEMYNYAESVTRTLKAIEVIFKTK